MPGGGRRPRQITADRVAIVTDMAITVDRIDEARVEEARCRAEARLRDKDLRRGGRNGQREPARAPSSSSGPWRRRRS